MSNSTLESISMQVLAINQTLPSAESQSIYKVPVALVVFLSLLYGTVSLLAVAGNSVVIWIISSSRRMQNVTNLYIANLALADVTIGMFAIPFQFQAALLQRWVLPYFMCPFCPFVQAMSVNVSVFTLTAIALDRYRAVIYPLRTKSTKRKTKYIIAFIWAIAVSLATPMALSWTITMETECDSDDNSCVTEPFCNISDFGTYSLNIYRVVLFIFQYSIPLIIISGAYIRMSFTLWGSKAPGTAQSLRDQNILKNKKKVIKMLVIVVSLFALCWLPLQLYYVAMVYIPEINNYHYINVVFFTFDWIAMSNACYNPFIYSIYNEKFQREFQLRLSRCCCASGVSSFCGSKKNDKDTIYRPFHRNSSTDRRRFSRSTITTHVTNIEMVKRGSLTQNHENGQCNIPLTA